MVRTTPLPVLTPEEIERFWSCVTIGGPEECWPWQRAPDQDGYGLFKIRGTMRRANRIVLFLDSGIDPGQLLACHTCDNPACCNPAHIFGGTVQDNALDCKAKGRLNTASGDTNGSRTMPERLQRGDTHWTKRTPERAATGDRNGVRIHPECIVRGEALPQARLTAELVRQIRTEYAAGGITHSALAVRYGVTRQAISKVITRVRWGHVA